MLGVVVLDPPLSDPPLKFVGRDKVRFGGLDGVAVGLDAVGLFSPGEFALFDKVAAWENDPPEPRALGIMAMGLAPPTPFVGRLYLFRRSVCDKP